jgi:hypothetical protein
MQIADKLVNRSEELVLHELSSIACDNHLLVFPKMRLQDVILKGNTTLLPREFTYYTRAHFDFVLVDSEHRPVMAVEFDGPFHSSVHQIERDRLKSDFCKEVEFPLLRVNANHVIRKFRGMTLLRWIIEVNALEKAFYDAQEQGAVPLDEPFDLCFFDSVGGTGNPRFPYWLSADATQQINKICRAADKSGWSNQSGYDAAGNIHELAFVYLGDQIHWAKTGVRHQNVNFPIFDLAREVSVCELGKAYD